MQLALGLRTNHCLKVWGSSFHYQWPVWNRPQTLCRLNHRAAVLRHLVHVLKTNQYVDTNVKQTRADVGMYAQNSVSEIFCSCPWKLSRWPLTIKETILILDSDWNKIGVKIDLPTINILWILILTPIISERSKISPWVDKEDQIGVLTSEFRPSDSKQLDWKEWQWILRPHIAVNSWMAHKSQQQ